VRVVTHSDSPWFFGPLGWEFEDLVRIDPPVPHKGAQGLWEVEEGALQVLRARWWQATQARKAEPAPGASPETPRDAGWRETAVAAILTLDASRGRFWAIEQVVDARREWLKALPDEQLRAEWKRYVALYERRAS